MKKQKKKNPDGIKRSQVWPGTWELAKEFWSDKQGLAAFRTSHGGCLGVKLD